jgi:hypothetical protein
MRVRTFLIVVAVVGFLYAIGLLLAPVLMETSYGTESTPSVVLSDRYFGATLLTVALIAWLGRDLTGASVRPIITGGLIGFAVGFVVSLMGTLAGTMNASGWSAVVLYLLLTLGFAYYQFVAPPN